MDVKYGLYNLIQILKWSEKMKNYNKDIFSISCSFLSKITF